MLNEIGTPYQDYYNKSDLRSGSTLGLATARELGMKVCDIGIAELGMHSACETCGIEDIDAMEKCLTAFLALELRGTDDEFEIIL